MILTINEALLQNISIVGTNPYSHIKTKKWLDDGEDEEEEKDEEDDNGEHKYERDDDEEDEEEKPEDDGDAMDLDDEGSD